jgi:hypothetical protein
MGARASPETHALTWSSTVAADERSAAASRLSPNAGEPIAGGTTQTASFRVGALRLELSASPGAARLVVAADDVRDIYVVDPAALALWAKGCRQLLSLVRAEKASGAAEFRAPFLVDREGRTSITFEGHVSDEAVTYRLLVSGASSRVAGIMTERELIVGVTDAALGASVVARLASA